MACVFISHVLYLARGGNCPLHPLLYRPGGFQVFGDFALEPVEGLVLLRFIEHPAAKTRHQAQDPGGRMGAR